MSVNRGSSLLSKICCRGVSGVLDAVSGGFPPVVRLETTNACNARCIICPHREMHVPSSRCPATCMRGSLTSAPPRDAAKYTCTISASRCWTSTWKIGSRMPKKKASAG